MFGPAQVVDAQQLDVVLVGHGLQRVWIGTCGVGCAVKADRIRRVLSNAMIGASRGLSGHQMAAAREHGHWMHIASRRQFTVAKSGYRNARPL